VTKWEYQVIGTIDPSGIQAALDEAGENGWELVAVSGEFFFLKRPKLGKGENGLEPSGTIEEVLTVGRKFRKLEGSS
jgi:hypothetical protein